MPEPVDPVVVFDGDCAFCTWSADHLRRWSGGRLRVVPWQRADLAALGLTARQCADAVQFVGPAGRGCAGRAVALALQECPAPWRYAGRAAAMGAVAPLVEWAYRQVAANRYRLPGATPACRVA